MSRPFRRGKSRSSLAGGSTSRVSCTLSSRSNTARRLDHSVHRAYAHVPRAIDMALGPNRSRCHAVRISAVLNVANLRMAIRRFVKTHAHCRSLALIPAKCSARRSTDRCRKSVAATRAPRRSEYVRPRRRRASALARHLRTGLRRSCRRRCGTPRSDGCTARTHRTASRW